MAERLSLRLEGMNPQLCMIDAYKLGGIAEQITNLLAGVPDVLVNITGGTKPMSVGALAAAHKTKSQPFYVRSQRQKTEVDFYDFGVGGAPFVQNTVTISESINIEDYLVAYFGTEYRFTGIGHGAGEALERAVHKTLRSQVDEIQVGWKHESGAVDVDFIVRCNNQVGIIEAKTGGKAKSTDGIKQLAVAGGQRFFGTYTKRFLVIDQVWSTRSNNRALADAIGIVLVELPGFAKSGTGSPGQKRRAEALSAGAEPQEAPEPGY